MYHFFSLLLYVENWDTQETIKSVFLIFEREFIYEIMIESFERALIEETMKED